MSNPYRSIMSELEAVAQHYAGHPLAAVKLKQRADELRAAYDESDVTFALIALFLGEYAARKVPDRLVRDRVAHEVAQTDAALGAHHVKLK